MKEMSYNEWKTVLRADIPTLKGKNQNEALDYFRTKLGEPEELDDYEGEILYFEYDILKHPFVPVKEHAHGKSLRENDRWGVDRVLSYGNDYDKTIGSVNHTLQELNEFANELQQKFDIDPSSIRLLSYKWYNGSDEPREFGRREEV